QFDDPDEIDTWIAYLAEARRLLENGGSSQPEPRPEDSPGPAAAPQAGLGDSTSGPDERDSGGSSAGLREDSGPEPGLEPLPPLDQRTGCTHPGTGICMCDCHDRDREAAALPQRVPAGPPDLADREQADSITLLRRWGASPEDTAALAREPD